MLPFFRALANAIGKFSLELEGRQADGEISQAYLVISCSFQVTWRGHVRGIRELIASLAGS